MARRGPVLSALLATLLVVLASRAAAHSDLETSEPGAGARLDAAPTEVVLRFTGPIEPGPTSVRVTDGNGTRVDRDDVRVEGAGRQPVVTVGLDPLGNGTFTVAWSILSDDGHPNSGRFSFAVGNDSAAGEPPMASGPDAAVDPPAALGRALSYVGLALALGAAAWRWAVRPGLDGLARPAARALALGAALHVAGVALLLRATADSTGVELGVLAGSRVGQMLLLRLGAGLAALVFAGLALVPRNPSRLGGPVAVGFLLVAAVASAAIGHAAGEGIPGLAVDAMHLVASATWAGGLVLLLVALVIAHRGGAGADDVRRIGRRFGTVALACVFVLVLAGLSAAAIILGPTALTDPAHLLDSLYGRLLLAKVGLSVLMLGVAAANRFVFLGDPEGRFARIARLGPDGSPRGLRRTVAVEAALGLVVLLVAGVLTATSPTDHDAHQGHDAHDLHAAHALHLHSDAGLAAPLHIASGSLISGSGHGRVMNGSSLLAPLHAGHEGGGAFDAYNLTVGGIVLVVLALLGFGIYKLVQRRRGLD